MEATLAELKRAAAGRGGLSRHQGEKEVPAADADDEEGEQPPGRSPLPPALGAGRGGGGGAGNEKKGSQGSPPSPLSGTPAIAAAAAAACAPASRRGVGSAGAGLSSPCCQAEMCAADLTGAKRYHRRHKVCEAHAKAAAVMVAGLRQRFCQQCSKFHELSEFDESKRSCRRRLAGHNERRRKSSAESQGEGSNRCRQVDQSGRMQATLSGDSTYKHFQIR